MNLCSIRVSTPKIQNLRCRDNLQMLSSSANDLLGFFLVCRQGQVTSMSDCQTHGLSIVERRCVVDVKLFFSIISAVARRKQACRKQRPEIDQVGLHIRIEWPQIKTFSGDGAADQQRWGNLLGNIHYAIRCQEIDEYACINNQWLS